MATFYNRYIHTVRVKLSNGKTFGFSPRKDTIVDDKLISSDIIHLVNNKILLRRGDGDESTLAQTADVKIDNQSLKVEHIVEIADTVEVMDVVAIEPAVDLDTSSDQYKTYDNISEYKAESTELSTEDSIENDEDI